MCVGGGGKKEEKRDLQSELEELLFLYFIFFNFLFFPTDAEMSSPFFLHEKHRVHPSCFTIALRSDL